MNVISFTVWTLENNCFIVYTVMVVCFIGFTYYHKQKMEEHSREDKKKKILKINGGKEISVGAGEAAGEHSLLQPHLSCAETARSIHTLLTPINSAEIVPTPCQILKIMLYAFRSYKGTLMRLLESTCSLESSLLVLHNEYNFPGPDDDPDKITSAIPEDTPQILYQPPRRSDEEVLQRSRDYYELMAQRRSVRAFSPEPIPQEVLDNIIKTAGTSPSGAHTEPWTFVVVQDTETKAAIRNIVEEEEELNYNHRMSRQWVSDLKPFKTRPQKPYLSDAPAIVMVFRQTHSWRPDGKKKMHYYSEVSVAIAAGILLAAVQYCGLVALTSTPLNCNSRLRDLLCRPSNERLELLLPVGRPHPNATVPDLQRKTLDDTLIRI